MKKLLLVLILGMSSLFAATGAEVDKAKYQISHAPKGKSAKCGAGKCGGTKKKEVKAMKCGAGKCGSVKIPTH